MFGRKKTFAEIRNEEINQDLSLYYLHIYQNNYENEKPEEKKSIREYYDRELRYEGAFYRDRKYFREHGNPETWTPERKKRFKVITYHSSYLSGMNIFRTFSYETTYLVNLDLNKPINLVVIDVVEGVKDLMPFETELRAELQRIKNLMLRLDNKKNTIMIRKGFEPAYFYNLGWLQLIFKMQINNIIRYISTNFIQEKFLIETGISKVHSYLSGLVKMDEGNETEVFIRPSNPEDREMDLDFVEIQRIFIVKRTDIFKQGMERNTPYPYELEQKILTSMVIQN